MRVPYCASTNKFGLTLFQARLLSVDRERDSLSSQLLTLQATRSSEQKEIEALRLRTREWQQACEDSENAKKGLQQENDALNDKLQAMQATRTQAQSVQFERDSLSDKLQFLTHEKEFVAQERDSYRDRASALQQERDRLRDEIRELQKDRDSLYEQVRTEF